MSARPRPWVVRYQWDTGIKGSVRYTGESQAKIKAEEVRRYADLADRQVTVTVEYSPAGGAQ